VTIGRDDGEILAARATERARAGPAGLVPRATITPRTLAGADATLLAEAALPESFDLPRVLSDQARAPTPTGAPGAARSEYTILSTLGEGGMGRVHLARQLCLERDVAIKTLKPGAPRALARALLSEAKITGALEHPGVIPVHTLGVDEHAQPVLVMKRIDGVHLGALLADPAHPAWRARVRSDDRLIASLGILEQVCQTVEFAHSRGIVHRDIKPENVMVGSFGEVYLLDWGIATTTRDAAAEPHPLVGTPAYMAPEMVRCDPVDERTDVYLLGATLHEILTGRPRHEGETLTQVIAAALASAPHRAPARPRGDRRRASSRDGSARPRRHEAHRGAP
jgi:serine/threonine-protein kinase